jgi:trimeric autotransporter adhesin
MKILSCLAFALFAAAALGQATTTETDCSNVAGSLASAASLAATRTSAFVQLAASAQVAAQTAVSTCADAATKAGAASSASVNSSQCITADASSFAQSAAAALATAQASAEATATAYADAQAASWAVAVAQGKALPAVCTCSPDVQTSVQASSLSIADSWTQLSGGVQTWQTCQTALAKAASFAQSCSTANSKTALQFCQYCGKGFTKITLNSGQNNQASQGSGSATCTAAFLATFGHIGPCAR